MKNINKNNIFKTLKVQSPQAHENVLKCVWDPEYFRHDHHNTTIENMQIDRINPPPPPKSKRHEIAQGRKLGVSERAAHSTRKCLLEEEYRKKPVNAEFPHLSKDIILKEIKAIEHWLEGKDKYPTTWDKGILIAFPSTLLDRMLPDYRAEQEVNKTDHNSKSQITTPHASITQVAISKETENKKGVRLSGRAKIAKHLECSVSTVKNLIKEKGCPFEHRAGKIICYSNEISEYYGNRKDKRLKE